MVVESLICEYRKLFCYETKYRASKMKWSLDLNKLGGETFQTAHFDSNKDSGDECEYLFGNDWLAVED